MLLSAQSAQLVEEGGEHFRKVFGPARFLHNGTYLICDTALWNLDRNYIKALGNVRILQDETVLTSDKLDYLIDENLAQFRGTLVQLTDKEGNLLRTRYLDFNTRDSVAVFEKGGAMKDKDGQIIESIDGTYDARIKLFTFLNDVNMFTDSVFVRTQELLYDGKTAFATFMTDLDAWRDDKMLSSGGGWYDRPRDLFFFERNVHGLTPTQEAWADSLYYDRIAMTVDMYGNAQVADSVRLVTGMAGHIAYRDSLSHITLTREPLIQAISQEKEKTDTTWIGGEQLIYYTVPKCVIDSIYCVNSAERLSEIQTDAVSEYRRKAAEEAEKARKQKEEELAKKEGRPGAGKPAGGDRPEGAKRPGSDAPGTPPPTEKAEEPPVTEPPVTEPPTEEPPTEEPPTVELPAIEPPAVDESETEESEAAETEQGTEPETEQETEPEAEAEAEPDSEESEDSEEPQEPQEPKDSTRIGFLFGERNVRIYRHDFQVACDSLAYTDLDSLARLYKHPFIWNEPNRQFSADSVTALIRSGRLDRASLMSNAFVAIQEDSLLYDQVRGTEMMAFFDSTSALRRFDALGGANALFYLEENGALATVNTVEAKMLSASFRDGYIDRILYFEGVKNDAYPVVHLPKESRELKGFEWKGELKPKGPEDISPRTVRASEREKYEAFPHAPFTQTDIYFPGYMAGVHKQIAENDRKRELRRAARRREKARQDSLARLAAADTLALPDSLGLTPTDSLGMQLPEGADLTQKDSLGMAPADSLGLTPKDSLSAEPARTLTPAELKAKQKAEKKAERERRKAERAARKAERQAAREARWAELDRRDAEKAAEKERRRMERLRKRNERIQKKIDADAERERRLFEQYKARYEKQKAKEEARKKKSGQ